MEKKRRCLTSSVFSTTKTLLKFEANRIARSRVTFDQSVTTPSTVSLWNKTRPEEYYRERAKGRRFRWSRRLDETERGLTKIVERIRRKFEIPDPRECEGVVDWDEKGELRESRGTKAFPSYVFRYVTISRRTYSHGVEPGDDCFALLCTPPGQS